MSFLDALFLGVVQGITEFLPISSSGHLIFFENILHLKTQTLLSFDVAVHFGSLIAILWYFRKKWIQFFKDSLQDIRSVKTFKRSYLLILIIGTLPAVVVGLPFKDVVEKYFRNIWAVIILWIILGIVLYISHYIKEKNENITLKKGFLVGIAQAIAILPGISRSGSTIVTGNLLGLSKKKAAEFSFFLGAIAILGASILILKDGVSIEWGVSLVGVITSFISSLIAITWLMKILERHSLRYFSYYVWSIALVASIIELV